MGRREDLLFSGQVSPELCPIVEAFFYFALKTAFEGAVEFLAGHIVGKIILAGKTVFGIMVIAIILAVAHILHHFGRGIEDMPGRIKRAGFLRPPGNRLERLIDRI